MVGLQVQRVAVPVGDAGVVAVIGKQRQLGAGCGLDPAADGDAETMSRTVAASGLLSKGTYVVSATSAAPSIQYGMGVHSASGMASMRLRTLWCCRTVMEKRTRFSRQAATMAWV